MNPWRHAIPCVLTAALGILCAEPASAGQSPAPIRSSAGGTRAAFTAARTPWGDPDLQGTYTNKDENGIPLERPDQFAGKTLDDVKGSEFAEIVRKRQQESVERAPGIGGAETGAGPIHWYEYYGARNSRPWLIVD